MFPIREEGGKELKTFDFDKPDFAFTAYTAEHAKMLWRMGALVSRGHHCFKHHKISIIHKLKPDKPQNPLVREAAALWVALPVPKAVY